MNIPEEMTSENLPFQELILDFTAAELAAVNDSALMTQELFDRIMDKCVDIGYTCSIIFQKLLNEWEFRSFMADFLARQEESMKEEKGE